MLMAMPNANTEYFNTVFSTPITYDTTPNKTSGTATAAMANNTFCVVACWCHEAHGNGATFGATSNNRHHNQDAIVLYVYAYGV